MKTRYCDMCDQEVTEGVEHGGWFYCDVCAAQAAYEDEYEWERYDTVPWHGKEAQDDK